MADITLYTNPMSRGRIARWMLEEIGASYQTVLLDYGGSMKAPDYLALNPMGKVPTVVHGDVVVTEVAAICAYLADAFPQAGLAPDPGSTDRGAYYRWLFFGAGPVEAAVTTSAMGVEVTPEQSAMAGWGSLGTVLDTLDGLLSGRDYVLGDRVSAADIYLGAQVIWGLQFGTMEPRQSFRDYAERLTGRAAETDDAAMPQG